tara:strand:+ start:147 stop:641 length:495 start_codon:yes stop_codon:yes gene_type:complete
MSKDPLMEAFNAGSDTYALGKIMEFVLNSEKFGDWKAWEIKNAIGYAVDHNKYFLHFTRQKKKLECIGFCTWGFFKRHEIDDQLWHGNEAYARCASDDGEILYFPMFLCQGGATETLKFIRTIQKYIWQNYPDIAVAEGWREYSKDKKRKAIMHIVRSDRYAVG